MIKVIDYNEKSTDRETNSTVAIDISVSEDLVPHAIKELENMLCRAKETLSQQVVKPKTWDQKEENQVVPQEQESSIHNNDQRLPEKEQSQKIVKTNKKQYIVSYPQGVTKCLDTGIVTDNCTIAQTMIIALRDGLDITIPNTWKVQVIDL